MRNFYSLVLLLISFCLFSCQKDEMLYSCDSQIEKWAIENKSEINKMTRKQFLEINNFSIKKAAYRAFTFENKQEVWREKYRELETLDWSKAEWKHISLIYSLVLSDERNSILRAKDVEEDDNLLIFSYRWEDYAKTTLGWTRKQIYAICYTVEKVMNKQGDLDVQIEQRTENLARNETGGSGFECSCSQKSSYCDIIDHEGPAYTTCKTPNGGGCKVTSGCGLFWQFDCDGMCLGLHV